MNLSQFLLLKLQEECAEVSQRAAKQSQFGKDQSQALDPHVQPPYTDEMYFTNRERLQGELSDLLCITEFLRETGEIEEFWPTLEQMQKKRAKIKKFLTYSIQLGKVDSTGFDFRGE